MKFGVGDIMHAHLTGGAMKVSWHMAFLALALLLRSTVADSIDDAEARRRNLPVAQVQAENALAAETRRETELVKQIAEAKKRISELTSESVGVAEKAPMSATKGPGSGGAASASSVVSRSSGPSTSPFYDDYVTRYLAGDWERLATDMTTNEKEMAVLPAANAADLTYIKQVLAECRPSWWDAVKNGKIKEFRQEVWKQSVQVHYQPEPAPRMTNTTTAVGAVTFGLGWAAEDMDSSAPLMLSEMGLNNQANFGFRKADGAGAAIWTLLGQAALMDKVGPDRVQNLTAAERQQFEQFSEFRKNLTAAYYGTPPVRRLIAFQCCVAFESANDMLPDSIAKRPLGAALMLDMAFHRKGYPHLSVDNLRPGYSLGKEGHEVEAIRARPVAMMLLSRRLTLAEDRLLRDLFKVLAESNFDWQISRISLCNNLAYEFNQTQDVPLAIARTTAVTSGKAPAK
jgi:hypothetical protein